jgi:hypothetical protein
VIEEEIETRGLEWEKDSAAFFSSMQTTTLLRLRSPFVDETLGPTGRTKVQVLTVFAYARMPR